MSAAAQERREPVTIVGAGLAGRCWRFCSHAAAIACACTSDMPDMRRSRSRWPLDQSRACRARHSSAGARRRDGSGATAAHPDARTHAARHRRRADFRAVRPGRDEVIYSVSRPGLNCILLDAAERAGVEFAFAPRRRRGHSSSQPGVPRRASGRHEECPLHRVFAHRRRRLGAATSDGERARSARLGGSAQARLQGTAAAARRRRQPRIDKHALHIWPRGGFMLIALPNLDGSFTVTLFLPHQGEESFASLTEPGRIAQFFRRHFPDVCRCCRRWRMSSCCIPPASWARCAANNGPSKIGCC